MLNLLLALALTLAAASIVAVAALSMEVRQLREDYGRDIDRLGAIVNHNAEVNEGWREDQRRTSTTVTHNTAACNYQFGRLADVHQRTRRIEQRLGINPLAPLTPIHIDTPESWTLGG